jgi:hypothetical protein
MIINCTVFFAERRLGESLQNDEAVTLAQRHSSYRRVHPRARRGYRNHCRLDYPLLLRAAHRLVGPPAPSPLAGHHCGAAGRAARHARLRRGGLELKGRPAMTSAGASGLYLEDFKVGQRFEKKARQCGQSERPKKTGVRRKLETSVSIPVENARPVAGHLAMTTLIVAPRLESRPGALNISAVQRKFKTSAVIP